MPTINLQTPVEDLTRVGKTIATRLHTLGIQTAQDLLLYFPFRYVDYSKVTTIEHLVSGEPVTVRGVIELIKNRRSFSRHTYVTESLVRDHTGSVKIVWFNQPYLVKILKPGDEVYISGELDGDKDGPQFISPLYEKAKEETIHTARIIPIYPLTKNISQKQLRFLISQVIHLAQDIEEWLPEYLIKKYNLSAVFFAVQNIHFPQSNKVLDSALYRLKFDELLRQQVKVQYNKLQSAHLRARSLATKIEYVKKFVSSLPFTLTKDQKIASWQILQDMEKDIPMNRLMEGDVGSGKTVVAAIAALNCALNRGQAVFMAPTEVLALQHYEKISKLFKDFDVTVALITRTKKIIQGESATKAKAYKKIEQGEVDVVIGTHAIIAEDIRFKEIGLAIIDEQHRFGVEQRKLLIKKSHDIKCTPHFLSMTATPIPRTLSLMLYGDLDISIIREMPSGRKKIITKIVLPQERRDAYEFIRERVAHGEQVFVVCPLIDPTDALGVRSVTEEYEKIQKEIFPEFRAGMLHGKMKPQAKEDAMNDFKVGEIQIMVATSVIEVGVDIPNATIMFIEGAERFGLAQLYQFRGRVGRSDLQSYCFLFMTNFSERANQRLHALLLAKDNFELAKIDMELRGPGDVYGVDQSGFPEFKLAKLTDVAIMQEAHRCAQEILALPQEKYPKLWSVIHEDIRSIHPE